MDKQFKKLYEIPEFKVVKVVKHWFQAWDDQEKKYIRDTKPFKGASRTWLVECDDFMLSLSTAQFSTMLEACFSCFDGVAKPEGKKFTVKTNGKQGKDIRYYINLAFDTEAERETDLEGIKQHNVEAEQAPLPPEYPSF